jgi:hypothetical protein
VHLVGSILFKYRTRGTGTRSGKPSFDQGIAFKVAFSIPMLAAVEAAGDHFNQ